MRSYDFLLLLFRFTAHRGYQFVCNHDFPWDAVSWVVYFFYHTRHKHINIYVYRILLCSLLIYFDFFSYYIPHYQSMTRCRATAYHANDANPCIRVRFWCLSVLPEWSRHLIVPLYDKHSQTALAAVSAGTAYTHKNWSREKWALNKKEPTTFIQETEKYRETEREKERQK